MLSLRGLAFAYPGRTVFAGLSAEIGPGVTWLVGDDGSGKTTLLELIAGVRPCEGTIAIGGVSTTGAAAGAVAWCDPRDEADDALGVAAFLDRSCGRTPGFDAAALERHLDGFGLRPHLGKSMSQLSTGTRRKVGLAATFAIAAPVTLLDDPAAALDAPSVAHLMRTLDALAAETSRVCLVAVHAAPPGAPASRIFELPPRA